MAFNISNLLATLDSSIAALDSASELLEVLQAINATNSTKGYGKTQRKYYTSVASLPAADSAMRGMVAVVSTAVEDSDNGLYLCTGSAWTEIQSLDSTTPYSFQGTISGYASGGNPVVNTIQKFSFTSDGNATDVGDLTIARDRGAGQSSNISGYTSGGGGNVIDKFPFTSDANAIDVGDLTRGGGAWAGQSSSTHGYTSGGQPANNIIDKFPFSSDASASDVGDLTEGKYFVSGQSSQTHGYVSGGRGTDPVGTVYFSTIDKFPFTVDENGTDVADLASIRVSTAGQSSGTHGYVSGGQSAPIGSPSPSVTLTSTIEKFPFSSDANATEVGNLTRSNFGAVGQSSTTHGYTSGGNDPLPGLSNEIQKFPFASDGTASDVGDLLAAGRYAAGQQN